MKKIVIMAAVLGAASVALAGEKASYPVVVGDSYAYGTTGSARNSADTQQKIGCEIWAGPGYRNAYCAARNSSGVQRSCWTDDPQMLEVASTVTTDSYISFSFNTGGACTFIFVRNGSEMGPKQP